MFPQKEMNIKSSYRKKLADCVRWGRLRKGEFGKFPSRKDPQGRF